MCLTTNEFKEGPQYSNALTLKLPVVTDSTADLIRCALQGIRAIYRDGYLYKKAGVMLTGLVPVSQTQADLFDEAALRPDSADFQFDDYFRWDYTLGKIEVNDQASAENQQRAEATIRLYRLNEGHPSLRKRELRRRAQGMDDPLDDFAYRGYVVGP